MKQFHRLKFFHLDFHEKFSLRENLALVTGSFAGIKNKIILIFS